MRASLFDEGQAHEALACFDDVWRSLTLAEQIRLINLLMERIDCDWRTGDFEILFHETGIQTFEQELALLAEENVA